MGKRLGILRAGEKGAASIAAHSRTALDRPLGAPGELWTAVATDDALLLGAFQRASAGAAVLRRGSGGPEVRVGPGTVHIALALAHPGALVACDAKRIVNRSVRPLLGALTRIGALAHFFGRDWVSVAHRPAAWVGFGHDAGSGRTLFEAFVGLRTSFHAGPRASFLGKEPGSLEAITGAALDPARVVDAVVEAYAKAWDAEPFDAPAPEASLDAPVLAEPPWAATAEEAIGTIGAGPDAQDVFRIGGDLLVSRDALARLEAATPSTADADLPALVDATLAAPAVALDGVRSLESICAVIRRALAAAG
jgi:hypothetical protein